jgi:PAS domain S-box-containing protein
MLAKDIDFHELFKISPTGMALLTADLVFVDANDEFLEESGRSLEMLVGHNFFEEFPKMHQEGAGRRNAVEDAMTSGRSQRDLVARYDMEDPVRPGVFVERYWSVVVQPMRDVSGELLAIELSVRNITPVVEQVRAEQEWFEDA